MATTPIFSEGGTNYIEIDGVRYAVYRAAANPTSLLKFSLKTNLVKSIISEIVSNFSKYYYAYGRSYAWPLVNGVESTSPANDSYEFEVATRNDLLFYKQIDANDISVVIPRINWTAGYTFDMYDEYSGDVNTKLTGTLAAGTSATLIGVNTVFTLELSANSLVRINGNVYSVVSVNSNTSITINTSITVRVSTEIYLYVPGQPAFSGATALETSEFYCMTDDYHVYKCIFNDNGKPSQNRPSGTDEKIIELADNYKWKYMYTIPLSMRNKFLSLATMPVATALSNQFYSAGSIVSATIENPGYRYVKTSYRVTGFKVVSGGAGYGSNAGVTVTLSSPDISGGTAAIIGTISVAGGAITGVSISNPTLNSGYQYPPEVTVAGGTPSSVAVLEPIMERISSSSFTTLSITGDGVLEENPYQLEDFIIANPGSGYSSVTFAFKNPDLANGVIAAATGVIGDLSAATLTTAIAAANPAHTVLSGAFSRKIVVGSVVKIASTTYTVTQASYYTDPVTQDVALYPYQVTVDAVVTITSGAILYLAGCVTGVTITERGFGYSKKFFSNNQDPFASNLVLYDSVSISQRTGVGLSFDVNTRINPAEIVPIINDAGEIESVRVVKPGIGYTFGIVTVNDSYTSETRPTDFQAASILLNFGIGDIESRQSTVELTAKDGAIHAVRVITPGSGYNTVPTVQIVGDGVGATAVAVLQDSIDGTGIERIDIINEGIGYTSATAVLSGATSSTSAILSVPISPKGGHGKDAISELYAKSIMFHGQISKEKNKDFLATNDYRQVCIMKNPKIFGKNQNVRSSVSSTCFVAIGPKNQTNFANITIDMIMTHTVGGKTYNFRVVEKNANYSATESALLLSYSDNYIPNANAIYANSSASVTFNSLAKLDPDVNKFSGEMLTIDNRSKFAASDQQIIVASNSLTF
jgi:hypothetical protein